MIMFGFILGFLGYLPLGNINLTVVRLSMDNQPKRLWTYILFASFMEFVYCVGCLEGMTFLLAKPQWVTILEWTAVGIFILLGLLSFFHSEENGKANNLGGFGRGVFAAAVNPLQIPFWLVWGVYMTQNKWLSPDIASITFFAFVTTLGTVTILWLYASGGKRVVEKLKLERRFLDKIIGVLLIGLALWQLFKLLWK